MIDPILSLAFTVRSSPGAYALLLGSGVSRSAQIPTGWEIVLDLIRRLAHLQGVELESDSEAEAWYVEQFSEEPDYAKLLEEIAKSPSERKELLRSYFEPTTEEREQGLKVPTLAHKAIAELVVEGYIKVIVTTNFDRLLEKAIEEAGLVPTVISTPDAIEGAPPLAHTKCAIIKVHGDYLDARIRNTREELENYDDRISQLLDRVFDEYGLVVCGWSAEGDIALRTALERCKSQRFTLYWAAKGTPGDAAKRLVQLRRGQLIQIEDADAFFMQLNEKVMALRDLSVQRHPLSAKVAVATAKRYLSEDHYRIALHNLVAEETERLYGGMLDPSFSVYESSRSEDEFSHVFMKRLERYETLAEILQSIMIAGCRWGDQRHTDLWVKALERIASPPDEQGGVEVWLKLRLYPALLLVYSGGLAALAAENYETFAHLLTRPTIHEHGHTYPLLFRVYADQSIGKHIPGKQAHSTPLSDYLFSVLRGPLSEYLPDEARYQRTFDRFEYLFALVDMDLRRERDKLGGGLIGSFGWRYRHRVSDQYTIMGEIELEATSAGKEWPPLRAGLFGGSGERFLNVKRDFDRYIARRWGW